MAASDIFNKIFNLAKSAILRTEKNVLAIGEAAQKEQISMSQIIFCSNAVDIVL